ncbi:farnesol dehydrogenase-like [Leptopilina heterotoma]|uniref:farnesol dehydrogenase-like n=1 Tax=Leptopilina heterotoma TaxID=63436 RepID=UPI001CA8D6A3|nr:farnesol dehydrogenase-like [Leptopilina heterotoma]
MERWINKVAVITGASSGIGATIVKALVKKNVKVVGLARRLENMEKIKNDLNNDKRDLFFPIKCDVSKEEDILNSFKWIEENLKSVDILVNNAALGTKYLCIESSTENIRNVVDLNLIGPTICIRETIRIMKEKNSPGHIFNIASILGQNIQIFHGITFNLYGPTKFALKAISDVIELELESIKSPIKVTTIYPGLVKTEMPPPIAFKVFPYLDADDISDAVLYALSTPPHVQIKELTITPLQTYQREENEQ